MKYINIYKLQGDSSYFNIDKPEDNIDLAGKKCFLRYLSHIIKIRNINIYKPQGDS